MIKNRFFTALIFLILPIFLTGCLFGGGSVSLSISPDPIQFTAEDTEADITLEFKTSGFGNVQLDEIVIIVWNDEDGVKEYELTEALEEEPFVVPGVTFTETVSLDLQDIFDPDEELNDSFNIYYDEELKGIDYYRLEITLTGSRPTTAEASIEFE